jgi:rhodanese-related sulfurtransferase
MSNGPVVSDIPEVGPAEAARLTAEGAVLLDVRESKEWDAGHAPAATLLPMSRLQDEQHVIPRDRTIVAICRSGARSGRVTLALNAAGYDAVNVAGGMKEWAATGLPVITDAGTPGQVI